MAKYIKFVDNHPHIYANNTDSRACMQNIKILFGSIWSCADFCVFDFCVPFTLVGFVVSSFLLLSVSDEPNIFDDGLLPPDVLVGPKPSTIFSSLSSLSSLSYSASLSLTFLFLFLFLLLFVNFSIFDVLKYDVVI